MTDCGPLIRLAHIHTNCSCIVEPESWNKGSPIIEKEGCEVAVENLTIAMDCDACQAFTENDTRPDIVSVRKCSERFGWLIIEMKSTMRPRAADQAAAALKRIGQDPMFPIQLKDAHVVFVIKHKRRAANTIMRNIGRIEAGRWRVVPRLIWSGGVVECRHR